MILSASFVSTVAAYRLHFGFPTVRRLPGIQRLALAVPSCPHNADIDMINRALPRPGQSTLKDSSKHVKASRHFKPNLHSILITVSAGT